MIIGQKWGADQSSLLKVYRAFIRAKLDYGAVVYGSASKSALNSLNGIVTEALRICTGSFKTTPIATLHILANEMDPQHRREYLSLRYYYKIKSYISNPANQSLIPLQYRTIFRNKGIAKPLALRTQDMLEKDNLRKTFIKLAFSYTIYNRYPYVDLRLAHH